MRLNGMPIGWLAGLPIHTATVLVRSAGQQVAASGFRGALDHLHRLDPIVGQPLLRLHPDGAAGTGLSVVAPSIEHLARFLLEHC
jgi:hypothetical protein